MTGHDEVSVTQFGTHGEGNEDAAPAIQAALDSGAATVNVPGGIYVLGSCLKIGSDTTLRLAPDAVMRLAPGAGPKHGADGFLIRNADPEKGNSGITIEGGIWDGNSAENPRGPEFEPGSYGGVGLSFIKVRGLKVRDLTIRDTEAFALRAGEVADFAIENITLDYRVIRPNQDGIHIGGFSENGVIRNIRGVSKMTPNDDMVALNADDDITRHFNRGMKRGWIRHVLVENISAPDAYTFVRMLSNTAELGDITIRHIEGGCRYYALNLNRWRFPKGVGNIHDVFVDDVRVNKVSGNDLPLIPVALNVKNMVIRRFVRTDREEKAPTILIDPFTDAQIDLDLSRLPASEPAEKRAP